ncbi:MAG: MFS transporter [Candidatus Velthaea sp.]
MNRSSVILGLALFTAMIGSNLPAPLYEIYRARFGLSAFVMTAIFATYPMALVVCTVGLARFADRYGRRPVLIASVAASAVGSLLFAWAPDIEALFVARVFAAVSIALAAAGGVTAIVEVQPDGNRPRAALIATFALSLACGVAPFFAGVVAMWLPFPLQLQYIVHVVLALAVALGLLLVPETRPDQLRRTRRRPRALVLAPGTTGAFIIAATTSGVTWLVAGLFVSVVPSFVATLLNVHNLALQGSFALLFFVVSPLVQVLLRRTGDRVAIAAGLCSTIAGMAGILLSVPLHSIVLLSIATVFAGAGQGASFFGAQSLANRIAIPERRAETTGAFYAITYGMIGLPILALGAIATHAGLYVAFVAIGTLAIVCSAVLLVALRVVHVRERLTAPA